MPKGGMAGWGGVTTQVTPAFPALNFPFPSLLPPHGPQGIIAPFLKGPSSDSTHSQGSHMCIPEVRNTGCQGQTETLKS